MACRRLPTSARVRCAAAFFVCAALGAATWAAAAQPGQPGDAKRGERLYAQCLSCHALDHNVVGPKHCGLLGRRAGSVQGFDYSPAMRRSGITWNAATLDRFLADPMKAVPGTSMVYAGVADTQQRADLIAWLTQANASGACR